MYCKIENCHFTLATQMLFKRRINSGTQKVPKYLQITNRPATAQFIIEENTKDVCKVILIADILL